MKNITNLLLWVVLLASLLSCTNSASYEIKSPCVAIESESPYAINPCTRRPANSNWEIG